MTAAAPAAHVTSHRLRFNDTDKLGHVNNAVFAVMLEQGRAEMLSEAGLPIDEDGKSVVIVRLELDFIAEMLWPGEVRIETTVSRAGNRSFTLQQELFSGGRLTGRGVTVLVVMDHDTRRAVAIDPWRPALERWLVPAA